MFNFKKFINSSASLPEIREIDSFGYDITDGSLFIIRDGEPIAIYDDSKPEYVCLKNCNFNDTILPCIRITPDMVFEVEFADEPAELTIGSKVRLATGETNYPVFARRLTEEEDESLAEAQIYSTLGAKKAGDKVLITFIA